MTSPWLAYLPPHLAADLLAHPNVSPLDRVLRQTAVALFADISGFTPMSEALGNVGPRGTEELSGILNRTFGTMIARISAAGGSIGKFAGDALTVLFPTTARTRRTTLRRAIQCALTMQADLAATPTFTTSAGAFSLTMKIGIGMGDLLTTTVGDPAIRLEYLLAGSAITACAAAEHHAPTGAVVLPDALLPLAGRMTTLPLTDGYQQVVRLHHRPPNAPHRPFPDPTPDLVTTITRYLPPTIAERVATAQHGLVDEHRIVTTLFVRFAGMDYQANGVVPSLQSYLAAVVQIIARYGGYLRQVDVGDKGSLYIVLFGAPLTHEDDAERAVGCALELRTLAQRYQISTTTGITTGKVFCGLVGSHVRREYAAIGDSVNLAARLMSAAQPEQILVDATTRESVTRPFHWRPLPPLTVKGKAAPVSVAALDNSEHRRPTRLKAPSYRLPMVGRQAEYALGMACLARVLHGQGQVLRITAEAGMGKSRLVAELMRSHEMKQLRAIPSECLSYGIDSSYLVWQQLLRTLFELTPDMATEHQIAQVRHTLTQFDTALVKRMPLLGVLLGLPIPESGWTHTLDAQLRKSALEALIVECLRHWTKRQPLLLIVEDCHWIDALSEELVLAVAHGCRDVPLLLLLTARPQLPSAMGGRVPGAKLMQLSDVQDLRLAEFTHEETATLIGLKLERLFGDTEDLPPVLLERISTTAQGNPFYIDELLNLLHDRGIDVRDAQALAQLELPSSLQRLILSRIDQLEEGPKSALKVGSIIGRLFKAHWLHTIYPALGTEEQVARHLTQLQQLDLTQLERADPELEYLFKHIITREVAYESLAVQTRAILHEQVGAFIEQTYAGDLEHWLDVLAYHYGHSTNVAKQREYYTKAGQAAKAACANESALSYFRRLLAILPHHEQGATLLALAEVEELLGHWEAAEEHSRTALALAQHVGDQLLEARVLRIAGVILGDIGRYTEALSTLEQAQQLFTRLQAQHDLVQTLIDISKTHFHQGQYAEAFATNEACLLIATTIGDQNGCCRVLNTLACIAAEQGRYRQAAAYFEQALAIAEAHHLIFQRALLMGNLGAVYFDLGEYTRAYELQQRKLNLALPLGLHQEVAFALLNLGFIYQHVGQYVDAQQCYHALMARMHVFDPRVLGDLLTKLSWVAAHLGDPTMHDQYAARAIAVCRVFAIRYWLVHTLYDQAKGALRQHRYAAAQTLNDEALALATELGLQKYQFPSTLLAIHVQVLLGDITRHAACVRLDGMRSAWTAPHQQAHIDYTIWQIDPTQEQARTAAAAQYRVLYAQSPNIEYRTHYQELTGEDLPAPPALPGPPAIVYQRTLDLPAFLARVDALLAKAGNGARH